MKKIIFLILLFIVVFIFQSKLITLGQKYLFYSPCDTPIQYQIGGVDSRFNLSTQEFSADVAQAAQTWSNAWGKQLFINSGTGLKISLVYDQRQYLNSQITQLNSKITNEQSSIKPQIQNFNQESATFRQQESALNSQIEYWNSKGGASSNIYQSLISQQAALQAEEQKLNQIANTLNLTTNQYDTQINQLNQTVSNYNQVLSKEPEEGLYNPTANTINIYFNVTHTELQHTLTHELGHALGMVHVKDPAAIMYPYTNQTVSPKPDDIAQLDYVCRRQFILILFRQKIQQVIQSYNSN